MPLQILNTEQDRQSLFQGDIIFIDDAIRSNLIALYQDRVKKAEFAIVLTQSCDLVKRSDLGNQCKAQLIHMGILSIFDEYFLDDLSKYCEKGLFEDKVLIIDEGKAQKLQNSLEKLFNNNISDHFFIPEDSGKGLANHYVVDLRDQCLISYEYFEDILGNKRCELEEIYRAKLGYMVSQLFSRIGTKDWNKQELENTIKGLINANSIILSKDKVRKARQREAELLSKYPVPEQLIPALKQLS
jgi:hypothetical protein